MLTASHLTVSSFNATAKQTLRGMILGSTGSEELKIRTMWSIIYPLMNLLLLCLNSSILPCTGPQKYERNDFKIHYTTGHFIPKKYLSLVFYRWATVVSGLIVLQSIGTRNLRGRGGGVALSWILLHLDLMSNLRSYLFLTGDVYLGFTLWLSIKQN